MPEMQTIVTDDRNAGPSVSQSVYLSARLSLSRLNSASLCKNGRTNKDVCCKQSGGPWNIVLEGGPRPPESEVTWPLLLTCATSYTNGYSYRESCACNVCGTFDAAIAELFRHLVFTCTLLDIGLECLATWKDGSEMYFYGRLSGSGIADKEDKYRCFVSIFRRIILLFMVSDFLEYLEKKYSLCTRGTHFKKIKYFNIFCRLFFVSFFVF